MAQPTNRDSDIILTDYMSWKPWYEQLEARCLSLRVWHLVDPTSDALPKTEPTPPTEPNIETYKKRAAIGDRPPANPSDLTNGGQTAFKTDVDYYKTRLDWYKVAASGMFNVTRATTAAATHLGQQKHDHRLTKSDIKQQQHSSGQLSLRQAFKAGVEVSQHAANAICKFNIQQFRQATVLCLLNNNLPIELLARPSFREMTNFVNLEAEAALWLAGSHTGEAIASTIVKTLEEYSITSNKLGYFVLDNATNNDTAIAALARVYDFDATHQRLRCGPHTLNLIGQAIIFGKDREAYNNAAEQLDGEESYLREWRKDGPLSVLIDVINYIKTPQQYELFREFQRAANAELPAGERLRVLELVKPVVTRWNSYYAAFARATQLQAAYNSYAEHHISCVSLDDRRAN
ncbi:transposase-like protein [Paraphaeosphaeria minitans]|uniref:Transposase-like protein n=1 Tax=Paraphaeosphaeria minitans TaxID=565426 RepID=A0A9P6G6I9_9PLEO|nr:transposase-like protein [Paraphaeosphaeria minitans]KAF9730088.1 transposase-like protein [Paraphaeosphaeria minitans]